MSKFILDGPQIVELTKLVADPGMGAFDRAELRRALLGKLELDIDAIVKSPHFEKDVEFLIKKLNRAGVIAQFIKAIKDARPHRSDVQAFGPWFNIDDVEHLPDAENLESVLHVANAFLNADAWSETLRKVMARVCRVEVDGTSYGTGFLVGPDVVMTCYHVIREGLGCGSTAAQDLPSGLRLRFDYYRKTDGSIQGTTRDLAGSDWLLDFLPPSRIDAAPDPKSGIPQEDDLDFALLRLQNPEGNGRGWLEPENRKLRPDDPLFILHHPGQDPMQLSLDTKAVLQVDGIGPRVRYRTNTIGGTSGSPCFSAELGLVVLHQGTDPQKKKEYNQRIPLSAVAKILRARWKDEPAKRALLPWIDSPPRPAPARTGLEIASSASKGSEATAPGASPQQLSPSLHDPGVHRKWSIIISILTAFVTLLVLTGSCSNLIGWTRRIWETPTSKPPTPPKPIGMTLVRIEPDKFFMGTTIDRVDQLMRLFPDSNRQWLDNEQPSHLVRLSKAFYLGIHEVT